MKVIKSDIKVFQPITITLESQIDFDLLQKALDIAYDNCDANSNVETFCNNLYNILGSL